MAAAPPEMTPGEAPFARGGRPAVAWDLLGFQRFGRGSFSFFWTQGWTRRKWSSGNQRGLRIEEQLGALGPLRCLESP